MRISQIYQLELRKIIKKPIVYILLINFALPVFYGIAIVTNASHLTISGDFDVITYCSVNWNMLTMVGILDVLFAIIAAHIFPYEMERGQLSLLLTRGCNRKKVLLAKLMVLYTLLIFVYLLYYLLNIIIYYTVITAGTFINTVSVDPDSFRYMLMDLVYLIEIFIICNMVFLLGLYLKAATTVMAGIGLTAAFLILPFFPVVKYFVPAYAATAISNGQMNSFTAVLLCIGYLLIGSIPVLLACRRIEMRDMV